MPELRFAPGDRRVRDSRTPEGREPLGVRIPKPAAEFERATAGEQTMSRNDPPWGANGVACLKAACAARDHHKRAALIHLGGFWLSLAHAPPAQIDSVMAARIAAMERIQAELLGTPPTLH
jgi:hypothetical protein